MTELTKEQVEAYLATEEGASILEAAKTPLLNKRDELLGSQATLKEELTTLRAAESTRLAELAAATRNAEEQRIKDSKDFDAYKLFHEEEVAKYQGQLGTFKSKYAQKEADRLVAAAAAEHSKTPAPLTLLLRERVKTTVADDGNVVINVIDGKGETMYYNGEPATVRHLIESLKADEQYAPFFAGSGVSGSGTVKSETVPVGSVSDMNSPHFNLTKAMAKKV